ncbi:MAG: hypothetical protein QNJ54_34220 [Prochloraceae cyanobacterium]|nr:hypothetical protein [Prochloraceae cyanobacterium]
MSNPDKSPDITEIHEFEAQNSNFDSNQKGFDSNQKGFDSNPKRFDSKLESNPYKPEFPLTKSTIGELLGVSDVTIAKWLTRLTEIYPAPEARSFYDKKKITAWGFDQLVAYQRATALKIPGYDRTTGKIYWNDRGQPVEMVENPNRIKPSSYLKRLQDEILLKTNEVIATEVEVVSTALVPTEIDVESIATTVSINQLEAEEAMNEAMATLDQMGSRYQSSRAMRRKQIAAAALRDAAQDASLYAKVYDAGFSKLVGDMAEGIEGKDQDE